MPVTKNRFTKCGHKGYGVYCHRCKQADALEAQVLGMRDGDAKQKLVGEVKRLRSSAAAPTV